MKMHILYKKRRLNNHSIDTETSSPPWNWTKNGGSDLSLTGLNKFSSVTKPIGPTMCLLGNFRGEVLTKVNKLFFFGVTKKTYYQNERTPTTPINSAL